MNNFKYKFILSAGSLVLLLVSVVVLFCYLKKEKIRFGHVMSGFIACITSKYVTTSSIDSIKTILNPESAGNYSAVYSLIKIIASSLFLLAFVIGGSRTDKKNLSNQFFQEFSFGMILADVLLTLLPITVSNTYYTYLLCSENNNQLNDIFYSEIASIYGALNYKYFVYKYFYILSTLLFDLLVSHFTAYGEDTTRKRVLLLYFLMLVYMSIHQLPSIEIHEISVLSIVVLTVFLIVLLRKVIKDGQY